MASVSSPRNSRAGIVGINVTPFVDITLVLLIIMMVSATYIVSQSLKVELPRTASSDETVSRTYAVTISDDGSYYWNDQRVTEEELTQHLRSAKAGATEVTLVIAADKKAQHGSVVHVIDAAKVEGITKFAINVEKSK